jgi:hypothetical protein
MRAANAPGGRTLSGDSVVAEQEALTRSESKLADARKALVYAVAVANNIFMKPPTSEGVEDELKLALETLEELRARPL